MHAERDHLVRFIFPELKERCRKLRVQLIDIDLRWGVSEEDANAGKSLDICLDSIDTCRPYFLGLLGFRYGYIPPGNQHSITAQEIYHAVLESDLPKQVPDLRKITEGRLEGKRLSNEEINCLVRCYRWEADKGKYLLRPDIAADEEAILRSVFKDYSIYQKDRSYFFFRTEALTHQLAEGRQEDFFEQDSEKLMELKAEIRSAGMPVYEYNDLETFGHLVRDLLWSRIEAEMQDQVVQTDWLEQEAEFHELFMADRTRRFVGRRELVDRVRTFAESDDQPSVLVITGEPGCGKSALMSRCAEELTHQHPDWLILSHFVGASPSSANLRRMLLRFCTQLNRSVGSAETSEDIADLLKLFPELLAKIGGNRKVLFVIDAVNQLEKADHSHRMTWLPQQLPGNVRFVISTLEGEAHDALLARHPHRLRIEGLLPNEITELVNTYLTEIQREFPTRDIELEFFGKIAHGNPLYVLVALEELRLFGKFEELKTRIRRLPDSVPDLFEQVLERIETDLNLPLVSRCMSYIACGRHGMTAEELQYLLKQFGPVLDANAEPLKLPDLLWSRLYRSFGAYLFERSGVIDFFHGQLKNAVGKRYLSKPSDRKATHKNIAEYFENRWREPYLRALDELPHQLTKAEDWQGIASILCDLEFIEAKSTAGMCRDLISDYRSALSIRAFSPESALPDYAVFLMGQSHILAEKPWLTFQQAINEPDSTAPAAAAKLRFETGKETRPFFRILNKPRSQSRSTMTLPAHRKPVIACAFSPDGNHIFSASSDGNMSIWDGSTGKQLTTISIGYRCSAASFSPDGRRFVAALPDSTIRIWDVDTGSEITLLCCHDDVLACTFSSDQTRILSASKNFQVPQKGRDIDWEEGLSRAPFEKTLKLWNAKNGEELVSFAGHIGHIESCAFSPDGTRIVSASNDKTVRIWDVLTGKEIATLTGHTGDVKACAYSPDGRLIASGSWDMTVRIWDATNGKKITTFTGHGDSIKACAFYPDGTRIVSASADGYLKLWDVQNGKELSTVLAKGTVQVCAFSPDGARIICGMENGDLQIWDSNIQGTVAKSSRRTGRVTGCAFSPDGFRVVSASSDKTLKIWDAATAKEITTIDHQMDRVTTCRFSPDGNRILCESMEGILKVWDANDRKEIGTLIHSDSLRDYEFSPDGYRIVCSSYDALKIWDAVNLQLIARLEPVKSFAFSPDGRHLVTVSADKTLQIWNTNDAKQITGLSVLGGSVNDCIYSPDGRWIVLGSRDLKMWPTDGTGMVTFRLGYDEEVSAFNGFSPDGSRLVLTKEVFEDMGTHYETEVWDVTTGEPLFKWNDWTDCIFSPDGSYLVCGLTLYESDTGKEIATLESNLIPKGELAYNQRQQIALLANDGVVYMIRLENLRFAPQLITGWRKTDDAIGGEVCPIFFGCPCCRIWSAIDQSNLGKIIACSHCGESLKLNPFTIDGDWRRIARGWGNKV